VGRHAWGHGISDPAAAGFAAAAVALAGDALALPDSHQGWRERADAGRSDALPKSFIDGGWGFVDCEHGPADSVFDVQGVVRTLAGETIRKDSGRDSDCVKSGTARTDSFVARGDRSAEER